MNVALAPPAGETGWTKIRQILNGNRLPMWIHDEVKFNENWSNAKIDLAHEIICHVQKELLERDQIKEEIRQREKWLVAPWETDATLEAEGLWPQEKTYLCQEKIWDRAVACGAVGFLTMEIKDLRVGLADMFLSQHYIGPRIQEQHLIEVLQHALLDNAEEGGLMKESLLTANCTVKTWDFVSDTLGMATVVVTWMIPAYMSNAAISRWAPAMQRTLSKTHEDVAGWSVAKVTSYMGKTPRLVGIKNNLLAVAGMKLMVPADQSGPEQYTQSDSANRDWIKRKLFELRAMINGVLRWNKGLVDGMPLDSCESPSDEPPLYWELKQHPWT